MNDILQEAGVTYKRSHPNSLVEFGYVRFRDYRINAPRKSVTIDHVDIFGNRPEIDFLKLLRYWSGKNGWYYSPM